MRIVTNIILIFSLNSISAFGQSFESGKPIAWLDLTGDKYIGNDKDLNSFRIVPPEISCDSLTRKCAVTWDNSTERNVPELQEIKSYTIYFQVLDRKKNKILEKSYKWDKDVRKTKGDYVGRYQKIAQWPGLNMDYTTVNYWAQDIRWASKKNIKLKSDAPKASTLDDLIEGAKKAKRIEDMD